MARAAIVHDWLTGMRGGERCLEVIAPFFKNSDLYTFFYREQGISPELRALNPINGILGRLPGAHHYYRQLLPLYPFAARSLSRGIARRHSKDPYDLLVSVSHCAAKNISVPPGLFHLCYCLTPMRYIWDQYESYFGRSKLEPIIRQFARHLRDWDRKSAAGVNHFVAISSFVKERIKRVYGRDADVIYPPVRTDWITPLSEWAPGEGFLAVNALVPYKNVDLIIESFNLLRLPLTIVGGGPEEGRLRRMARENIRFIRHLSDAELAKLYRRSKALVFAAEEDFGMVPVEMQAAGRPIVALGKGGVLETVDVRPGNSTGILFSECSAEGMSAAIHDFLDRESEFTIERCLQQSQRFSLARFESEFSSLLVRLGLAKKEQINGVADNQQAVSGIRC